MRSARLRPVFFGMALIVTPKAFDTKVSSVPASQCSSSRISFGITTWPLLDKVMVAMVTEPPPVSRTVRLIIALVNSPDKPYEPCRRGVEETFGSRTLNAVFLLYALVLRLLVPQLRTWVLPLSVALYLINPLLLLATAVLAGGVLLWRIFP
jgi:hypothetical protein